MKCIHEILAGGSTTSSQICIDLKYHLPQVQHDEMHPWNFSGGGQSWSSQIYSRKKSPLVKEV